MLFGLIRRRGLFLGQHLANVVFVDCRGWVLVMCAYFCVGKYLMGSVRSLNHPDRGMQRGNGRENLKKQNIIKFILNNFAVMVAFPF